MSSTPAEGNSRADDARVRIELAQAHARHESEQAQRLIDEFIWQAQQLSLPAVPLRARLFSGQEVKTDKTGWYIRVNRSIAIGTDGGYYQLTVPGSMMARLRGVRLVATPPPLVVGRGGRDGETGDLKDFLAKALHPQRA